MRGNYERKSKARVHVVAVEITRRTVEVVLKRGTEELGKSRNHT